MTGPRLIITLEGGLLRDVCKDGFEPPEGFSVVVIDYDTDGTSEPEDIVIIDDSDATVASYKPAPIFPPISETLDALGY